MAAGVALAALSGCFTGIESTPGISKAEVKRQNSAAPSPEQSLISSVKSEPFSTWRPGKELIVTDQKISIVLTPASVADSLSVGDVLRYQGMNPVLTVLGDSIAQLVFTSPAGSELAYRSELTPDAMLALDRVLVPFTVEGSMVSLADSLLAGRKLYLMTTHRLSADGITPVDGRRYIPVTVSRVVAGNSAFPLRVIFADETGTEYSTFINPDTPTHTTRAFHRLFSLSDPRKKYPHISDSVWDNITRGVVAEEMTREECRLALGAPSEVDRAVGISNSAERWTYDNGTVLFFEEGLLTRFRR